MWKRKASPSLHSFEAGDGKLFEALLGTLRGAVAWNRVVAGSIFLIAIIGAIVALVTLSHLTSEAVTTLGDHPDVILATFLLIRAAAFAGIVSGLLYGLLNLGRAALDQAERYKKRQMAAHFMHYIFVEYRDRIGSEGFRVTEIIDAIDAWSRNVESAYTKVKLGGKNAENWAAFVSANGTSFAYGKDAVKAAGKPEKPEAAAS
jgi:hypothetical protein